MLDAKGRNRVYALILGLLVVSILLVHHLRPRHEAYLALSTPVTPQEQNTQTGIEAIDRTPFQAVIPVMMGFREVLAALMWVQADDLFHRGEYGPILALIKRIALIDPHNLDVYATGAWHMAYNFMDRRLVEDGTNFLRTGVQNNQHVYDLFFELGYMHYDKTKIFPQAVEWYGQARHKPTTTGKKRAPIYVYSAYCHALERAGRIDECIEAWKNADYLARNDPDSERDQYVAEAAIAITRHNLYMTQRRLNEREALWLEWQGKRDEALQYRQRNVDLALDYLKGESGRKDVREEDLPQARANLERVREGRLMQGRPKDLHFDFTWKRTAPRRIVVEGKIDMVGLARVSVILRDVDYERLAHPEGLSEDAQIAAKMSNATLHLDHMVQVKDGKFHHEIKLDRDPADMDRPAESIFPLKSDRYELTVIFDPRLQAADVQDRFGWSGEGLTDSRYLQVDPLRTGRVAGQERELRYLQKTVILRREDIV
jgi:tetratricopeptide (TPR) repeat protein